MLGVLTVKEYKGTSGKKGGRKNFTALAIRTVISAQGKLITRTEKMGKPGRIPHVYANLARAEVTLKRREKMKWNNKPAK